MVPGRKPPPGTEKLSRLPMDNLDRFAQMPGIDVQTALAGWAALEPRPSGKDARDALSLPLERVQQIETRVSNEFVGRGEAVSAVLASLVSGIPTVLLGPPGTAKSLVVRRIAERCGLGSSTTDGTYFEYLLTHHTMPEELFGPPDIGKLKEGTFERRTKGKLPEAELAFLDELFRGGSHILNTLLTLVNERKFHNGARLLDAPLLAIVGAANEPPYDPELGAFFDRFPVRVWMDTVFAIDLKVAETEKVAAELLTKSLESERKRVLGTWSKTVETEQRRESRVSCINDLRAAMICCQCSTSVQIGSKRFDEFRQLFLEMRERLRLSDRSFPAFWRFAAALDILRGIEPEKCLDENARGHVDVFRWAAPDANAARFARDKIQQFTALQGHTGKA